MLTNSFDRNLQFVKTAIFVKREKTRYARDLLQSVDERAETRRRHDLSRVTCWSVTDG